MSRDGKIKIVIFGFGKSGAMHLKCYAKLHDIVEIAAIIDENEAAANKANICSLRYFPTQEAIPFFRNLDELIAADIVDRENCVVDICVPNFLHYDVAEKLAAQGFKKLLVEKPLCNSVEECALFSKLDASVAVMENYFYSTITYRLKEIMDKNSYVPKYARIEFSKDRRMDSQKSRGCINGQSPHIFQIEMPHQAAIASYLFGKCKSYLGAWCRDMEIEGNVLKEQGEGSITVLHDTGVVTCLYSCMEGHNNAPIRYRAAKIHCENDIVIDAYYPSGGDDALYGVILIYEGSRLISKETIMDDSLTNALKVLTEQLAAGDTDIISNIETSRELIKTIEDNINMARLKSVCKN